MRLRRLSDFLRGAFLAAAGGEMRSNYFKYSALYKTMYIPIEVKNILDKLEQNKFDAFLVGGCVRDILLNKTPKDWDIATNALPEEIQSIFENSIYENTFGTVAVKTDSEDKTLKIIEITTYRTESNYTDQRHPDSIEFVTDIKEDLARRDFTINAIAINKNGNITDPFNGQTDLTNKIIKSVGDPIKRFSEDALRLMRAVRLSIELDFKIDSNTEKAILNKSKDINNIAPERIKDELIKLIMTPYSADGIRLLEKTNLLEYIIPELREGINCTQNKHHIDTVFVHNIKALEYASKENFSLEVRLASLMHDIGKPRTKRGEGEDATFYGHEIIGARITQSILTRLKFSKETTQKVRHLVRQHMFMYNVDEVSEAGVRRLLSRIGLEHLDDILNLRKADRIGSNTAKAFPYKLRHLLFMIEKVRRDPISPKALKINGTNLMEALKLEPSPRLGFILNALLEKVLDNPAINNQENLLAEAQELNKLTDQELLKIMQTSKSKQAEFEKNAEAEIKNKHHVK